MFVVTGDWQGQTSGANSRADTEYWGRCEQDRAVTGTGSCVECGVWCRVQATGR